MLQKHAATFIKAYNKRKLHADARESSRNSILFDAADDSELQRSTLPKMRKKLHAPESNGHSHFDMADTKYDIITSSKTQKTRRSNGHFNMPIHANTNRKSSSTQKNLFTNYFQLLSRIAASADNCLELLGPLQDQLEVSGPAEIDDLPEDLRQAIAVILSDCVTQLRAALKSRDAVVNADNDDDGDGMPSKFNITPDSLVVNFFMQLKQSTQSMSACQVERIPYPGLTNDTFLHASVKHAL